MPSSRWPTWSPHHTESNPAASARTAKALGPRSSPWYCTPIFIGPVAGGAPSRLASRRPGRPETAGTRAARRRLRPRATAGQPWEARPVSVTVERPDVVRAAEALAPLVADLADEVEAAGRLPDAIVERLAGTGLYHLYLPRSM